MGRAFEFRKARKLKRWGNMSRTFTRIGEITIAAKAAGPDPDMNPRLRVLMHNAKAANMPKDTIESHQESHRQGRFRLQGDRLRRIRPHGIAIVVETATDNNQRTVANVRSYFNKHGGSLGTSGSLSFLFDHKSVFHLKPGDADMEELELDLMDFDAEIEAEEEEWMVYGAFEQFANIQKFLEEKGMEIVSRRIRAYTQRLQGCHSRAARGPSRKLLARIEDDEDVQNVFHNMKEED